MGRTEYLSTNKNTLSVLLSIYGVHIIQITWEGHCNDTSTLSFTNMVGSRDTTSVVGEWLKASHILTSSNTSIEPHITPTLSTVYGVVCDSSIGVLRD